MMQLNLFDDLSFPTREPNPSPIPNQDPLDQKLDHLDYLDHLATEELMKDTTDAR